MKYLYLILLALVVSTSHTTAQRNFKAGYIVTLNGDTTKGFIDYKQWLHRNPDQVSFKANSDALFTNYTVADIKAFGIEDYEKYEAFLISISQNAVTIGDFDNFVDTTVVNKKVFLRLFVSGKKVNLYSYEDVLKQRLFVAEEGAPPYELKFYRQVSNADPTKIIDVNTYAQQLQRLAALYAPGNKTLVNYIQGSRYEESSLKNIIINVNGGNKGIGYVQPGRSITRFFVGIGGVASKSEFNGTHYFQPTGASLSYIPQINAGMDIVLNRNVGKTLFRIELNALTDRAEFNYSREDYLPVWGVHTIGSKLKFSRVNITLNPQFVYNFHNGTNFKAFISGGGAVDAIFYTSKRWEGITIIKNVTNVEEIDPETFKSVQFMLTTKAGVVINRFQIYLGYNPPSRLISRPAYGLTVTSYKLGLNYILGKN